MSSHVFHTGSWDGRSFGYGTLETTDRCQRCGMWAEDEAAFNTCEAWEAWEAGFEPDDPEPRKQAEA